MKNEDNIKEIYLAGGCFWGTEKYFSLINGVIGTEAGYANGNTKNPSYEDVCCRNTNHAETVKVLYDTTTVSLEFILNMYFEIIDPTSINRQGGDRGTQYRTGIYYTDAGDRDIIEKSIDKLSEKYSKPIAIEVMPLVNYYPAEEYHQKYLEKNPNGYCHISPEKYENAKITKDSKHIYKQKSKDELNSTLTKLQFSVTQESATEQPFKNDYYNNYKAGIYVDITTGEPLFISSDKFESGCGWPSFSKPVSNDLLNEITDESHSMKRVEVRSKTGDAHLGHVFSDGPKEKGGLRYCINSAALLFIPKEEMEEKGYGYMLPYVL